MASSILGQIETIDDRREIAYCLSVLPSVERVAFLYSCCDRVGPVGFTLKGEGVGLTLTNETGDYMESYLDLMQMISQFGLDVKACLADLERRVKEYTSPRGIQLIY